MKAGVVANSPSNAGDVDLILGGGTKIPHTVGQLSLRTTTAEPVRSAARVPLREDLAHHNERCCVLQLSQTNELVFFFFNSVCHGSPGMKKNELARMDCYEKALKQCIFLVKKAKDKTVFAVCFC